MYSVLWKAARPFLRRHKRLRPGFAERLVPPGWPFTPALQAGGAPDQPAVKENGGAPDSPAHPGDAPACDIWLQAASGGEAYLSRELLIRLAAVRPDLRVLCTTCTEQGLSVLHEAQLEAAGAGLSVTVNYLPLDEPALMRRALAQAFGEQPAGKLLVLLETEIWPGLLSACGKTGVKVLILNGRMRPGSFKAYKLIAPFLRRYPPLGIFATSADDLRRFSAIFDARPVQAGKTPAEEGFMPDCACGGASARPDETGALVPPWRGLLRNIKFDRLAASFAAPPPPEPPPPPGGLLVLASTREEEEKLLLPILPKLLAGVPDSVVVLAPRHLHRVEAWKALLTQQKVSFYLRSAYAPHELPKWRCGRVLLWDSFGELGRLYEFASAVFVGGSLAPLGGQNFLEPLGCGLVPCIGPHWDNFYWAGRELFDLGLVRQVRSARELAPVLLDLLRNPLPKPAVLEAFEQYLAPRRGGGRQAVELILRALAGDCPH